MTTTTLQTASSLAPCLVAAGVVEVSQAVAFQAVVGEAAALMAEAPRRDGKEANIDTNF